MLLTISKIHWSFVWNSADIKETLVLFTGFVDKKLCWYLMELISNVFSVL